MNGDVHPAPQPSDAAQPGAKRPGLLWIVLLQAAVLLFACSSLLMKLAGRYPMLSWPWIGLYGAALGITAVYAVLWQQFLKRMSLTTAYANRSMTMLWSMVFGALVFAETIRWNMVAGIAVIAFGIWLVVTGDD